MSDVRYPEVTVTLIGEDGNAFSILGKVNRALREHGVSTAECDEFLAEAKSADYDHLLVTVMKWVNIE